MISRMDRCKVCNKNHLVQIGDEDKRRSALLNEDRLGVGIILDAQFVQKLKDTAGGGRMLSAILISCGIDTSREYHTYVHDQCSDSRPVYEYIQDQDWPEESN